jgi:hypothetical protein
MSKRNNSESYDSNEDDSQDGEVENSLDNDTDLWDDSKAGSNDMLI